MSGLVLVTPSLHAIIEPSWVAVNDCCSTSQARNNFIGRLHIGCKTNCSDNCTRLYHELSFSNYVFAKASVASLITSSSFNHVCNFLSGLQEKVKGISQNEPSLLQNLLPSTWSLILFCANSQHRLKNIFTKEAYETSLCMEWTANKSGQSFWQVKWSWSSRKFFWKDSDVASEESAETCYE